MARYLGELVRICPAKPYDWTDVHAVAVSGADANPCGHLLLYLGGASKLYFHVAAGVHAPPTRMDQGGYLRYMTEHGKTEWRRWKLGIPNPEAAQLRLNDLTSKPWLWGALVHNCVTFVEEVIRAGGSLDQMHINCPSLPWRVPPPPGLGRNRWGAFRGAR